MTIFSEIIAGRAPASRVYEDDDVLAFMDIRPFTPGHLLVIPKVPASCLAELDPVVGGKLFQVGQRIAAALRASEVGCDGVNFFLADGVAAGQARILVGSDAKQVDAIVRLAPARAIRRAVSFERLMTQRRG